MDVPFVIFIPFGRGAQETHRRVPPASLQLPSRTAETYYELVVQVQQGRIDQKKYAIPVPISRYDTLSTFGMYSRREVKEAVTDHLVTLQAAINKWSFGPLDPVDVDVRLVPNTDYWNRVRKVSIQKITIAIVEEVVYNHEGDEPQRKAKQLGKKTETFGIKMPEKGFATKLGMIFPAKDQRDQDGVLPRGKQAFPLYNVHSFTTTASLYKIEYYLTVKVCLEGVLSIEKANIVFRHHCQTRKTYFLNSQSSCVRGIRLVAKPKWRLLSNLLKTHPTWTSRTRCFPAHES